ncbi:MAG: hypothetical protein Q9211_001847 [Gyalolechia sp. 1 TL-2023]
MEQHRMFIAQYNLAKEAAQFYDHVNSIVRTERPSGRKPESEKKFRNRVAKLGPHNEATMLAKILPLVIKEGRTVSVQGPITDQESSTRQLLDGMWEDFDDSGLDWTVDREFHRTYLPNAYGSIGYEEQIATALAKERGMKNPKPDRAFGLAINDIPRPEGDALLRDDTVAFLDAVPGLQHVFFLVEGVSSSGDLNKAKHQACRGGTVIVVLQRRLLAATNQLSMDDGPDRETFVYTATVDDHTMSFWVNFALVRTLTTGEKYVTYHMEHVYTCALLSDDAELLLRRACHNILDWGVRTRRPMLETRCAKMYQFDRLAIKADIEKLRAQATDAAAKAEQEQGPSVKGKKRKLAPGKVSEGAA